MPDTVVEHRPVDINKLQSVLPSDSAWDAFVDGHPNAHLLQTSEWAALKSQFGWTSIRVGLTEGTDELVAGASILIRSAFGFRIAYVPRGPLTDWTNPELSLQLLDEIEKESARTGAAIIKLEPGLADTSDNRLLLERYGYQYSRQTVQPQSTIVVDLSGEESDILARMKSKWRYNIRLSQRKDVVVRSATVNDLEAFNDLMTTTGERDGFGVHSPEYYRAAYQLLTPNRAVFLLAEYDDQPLAAIVVAATGDTAWYLWGASSNRERNRMPNHALQWAGMQWAREVGATRYDLWGIPDDLGKVAIGMQRNGLLEIDAESLPVEITAMPREDLWGVFRFKQGFGGKVVRDVGAWDKPLKRYSGKLYTIGLALREERNALRSAHDNAAPEANALESSPVTSANAWRQTLFAFPSPHVLQSWEWGEIKSQTGWTADRVAIRQDGTIVGAYQFLTRQLHPYLPIRIGYVPKGPLVDWSDSIAVDHLLDAVQDHAKRCGCIFVKIDPDVRSDRSSGVVLVSKLKRRGWCFSSDQIQFQNTAISRLPEEIDELLPAMKSKWRYNLRLAGRRGITVRQGSQSDLPLFYDMYAETGARDGFLIRPFSYYQQTWRMMLEAQADDSNPAGAALLFAEHSEEDHPIAGLFLMKYAGTAWYFYGASTDSRRRDMPNYLLQWEAMKWAQDQGCTVYDWWGAPTDISDPDDSMQGVWKFKEGFGAVFQPHIGAWDYALNPSLYALYNHLLPRLLEGVRRWRNQS